jgi:hypothetical protein
MFSIIFAEEFSILDENEYGQVRTDLIKRLIAY